MVYSGSKGTSHIWKTRESADKACSAALALLSVEVPVERRELLLWTYVPAFHVAELAEDVRS